MSPLDNVLQNAPRIIPKLNRVLPQINIPPPLNVSESNKKTILVIAIAVFVVALIILSAVLILKKQPDISPPVKPSQTPLFTPRPPPTTTQFYQTPSPTPYTPCGNGLLDAGEGCDGNNFGNQTCASLVGENYEGALSCTSTCKIDSSGCTQKRIIRVKKSPLPPLTQTSTLAPAPNAVKVSDNVKLSNSVKIN